MTHEIDRPYPPINSFWMWDIQQNRLYGDDKLAEYFGTKGQINGSGWSCSEFVSHIYEEDRERISAAVEYAITHRTRYSEIYLVRTRSGTLRRVLAEGQCHYDEAGMPTMFPGTLIDVTDGYPAEDVALAVCGHFINRALDAAQASGRETLRWILQEAAHELTDVRRPH